MSFAKKANLKKKFYAKVILFQPSERIQQRKKIFSQEINFPRKSSKKIISVLLRMKRSKSSFSLKSCISILLDLLGLANSNRVYFRPHIFLEDFLLYILNHKYHYLIHVFDQKINIVNSQTGTQIKIVIVYRKLGFIC